MRIVEFSDTHVSQVRRRALEGHRRDQPAGAGLPLGKPLAIDEGARENVTLDAASRDRITSTLGGALRVVASGHVHRCRRADGNPMSVWAPSLSFAPAAEPDLSFGPGASGVVEYTIQGRHVDARLVSVPGIEGAADVFALPEIQRAMEALGREPA